MQYSVPYVDGIASFTDLSVSEPGSEYNLTFTITYPAEVQPIATALKQVFRLVGFFLLFCNTYITELMYCVSNVTNLTCSVCHGK